MIIILFNRSVDNLRSDTKFRGIFTGVSNHKFGLNFLDINLAASNLPQRPSFSKCDVTHWHRPRTQLAQGSEQRSVEPHSLPRGTRGTEHMGGGENTLL